MGCWCGVDWLLRRRRAGNGELVMASLGAVWGGLNVANVTSGPVGVRIWALLGHWVQSGEVTALAVC